MTIEPIAPAAQADALSYSPDELAVRINREHEAAVKLLTDGLERANTCGDLLIQAKRFFAHGHWLPWLREHCEVSERTAHLYMRLSRHADEIRNRCGFDVSVREAVALIAKPRPAETADPEIADPAEMPDPRETLQAEKRERRRQREQQLGAKITALPEKKYGVLYADPPWRFKPYSDATGMDRAADNHYPTMDLEAIKALPIPAAADCVLFLWATVPMLPEAFDVMKTWGFIYKSESTWVKDKAGTGYWVRGIVEHLLIGRRGRDVPAPAPGEQFPGIIEAPRKRHSEKPDIVADEIGRLFPNVPKLEMFARKERPGWTVWGNEIPRADLGAPAVPDDLSIPAFLRRTTEGAE